MPICSYAQQREKMSTTEHSMIDCDNIEHIRQLWEHEDNLINQRMTWLGVTQTILFAAYGLLLTVKPSDCVSNLENQKELVTLLPIIGLATSILILVGIIAAIFAMKEIKKQCRLDCLGIKNYTIYMGLTCGVGLPIVFVIAWLCILI